MRSSHEAKLLRVGAPTQLGAANCPALATIGLERGTHLKAVPRFKGLAVPPANSDPQHRISKTGIDYLRRLLVQPAQYVVDRSHRIRSCDAPSHRSVRSRDAKIGHQAQEAPIGSRP